MQSIDRLQRIYNDNNFTMYKYSSSSLYLHEFVTHAVILGRHYLVNYRFTLSVTGVINLIDIIVGIKVYSKPCAGNMWFFLFIKNVLSFSENNIFVRKFYIKSFIKECTNFSFKRFHNLCIVMYTIFVDNI